MTGPHEADRLSEVRGYRAGGQGLPTPDCLDDDDIAALAEGALAPEHRVTALAHLATCGRCRRAVASVAQLLADAGVAAEVRAAERAGESGIRRLARVGLGIAAAAAIVLLVWPSSISRPEPHRGQPIAAQPAPEAVSPVGSVEEARSLRWTAVPGADLYRVTLFSADAAVRYETELGDPIVVLPDSALPVPGKTYWWKVEARIGFDRWAASELIEFSVRGSPRP